MLSIILPRHNEPVKWVRDLIEDLEKIIPVQEIIITNDSESRGKGWAMREGVKMAKGDYIAFLDGDGEIPARMLLRLLTFIDDFDVVVGSKRITKAPMRRKIMTHVARVWFRIIFGLPFDTQTGIKLFRRDAIPEWSCNSFLFDIELLYKAHKSGLRIVEVPIECEIRRQLAVKTIWSMAKGSFQLWWRLNVGRVGKK